MSLLLKLRAHAHEGGSITSSSRRPRSTRRSTSSRASASLSKDALISGDKHIFVNKDFVIILDHKDNKFTSPGNLEHFDPIVGTGSAPVDCVDSTLRGRVLKGAQPVGECNNSGPHQWTQLSGVERCHSGSSNSAVAKVGKYLVVPFMVAEQH